MKTVRFLIVSLFAFAIVIGTPNKVNAQTKDDTKEVTIWASMHCESCKKKIEREIAFEKGVKSISVDLQEKTVTIKYLAAKNSEEKLVEAVKKLGYETKVVKKEEKKTEVKKDKN
ncbi:MAG: heavy-metal-associated domain-containing protein [Tenuifilaceae bacterium]